jgi:hypothetical protein
MLTEETYRTEISASFKLSGVYTAPLVRLWWMIVVCDDFLIFESWVLGLSVTLPHRTLSLVAYLRIPLPRYMTLLALASAIAWVLSCKPLPYQLEWMMRSYA